MALIHGNVLEHFPQLAAQRQVNYEDIRALLIADYTDKGKVEMVDAKMTIATHAPKCGALSDELSPWTVTD